MLVHIYALVDPDTQEIRYVGQTKYPDARLAGHVQQAIARPYSDDNQLKGDWVRELASRGKEPLLRVLESVTEKKGPARESYWISCLRGTHRLLNRRPGGISKFAEGNYKTTQVYLSAEHYNRLKEEADRRAVSVSAVIREAVELYLKGRS